MNKEREEVYQLHLGLHLCTEGIRCCFVVLVIMLVALVLALPVYFYSIVEFIAPGLFTLTGS